MQIRKLESIYHSERNGNGMRTSAEKGMISNYDDIVIRRARLTREELQELAEISIGLTILKAKTRLPY